MKFGPNFFLYTYLHLKISSGYIVMEYFEVSVEALFDVFMD
jgi:hypothetical protein